MDLRTHGVSLVADAEFVSGAEPERQLKYWREHLEGAPELLELPTDRRRAAVQSYRGDNVEVALDEQLTRQLKLLSRRHDATLAMTLYAGWSVLLSRLSGQRDLVVGMPMANQRPMAVRVSMEDDPTVQELLGRVKEVMLGAYAHQDVPFEEVVKALQPTRSLSHSPIFQVMFVFHNSPAEEREVLLPTAQFDLTLTLQECADGIRGSLNYASDLFDASTMTRWAECFECVLRAMVSEPQLQTSQLSLLNTTQRRQVLDVFNATQATYPTHKLIHELFEEQVERTPHAIAVTFEDQSLSYAELEARSNQLARHLRECGVGADQLVAICVERGLEMIVGLLGILKAGGAYVPLDPNYPIERLEYMLQDAQPKVLLTQEQLRARLPASETVITLDADWSRIASQPSERLSRAPGLHSASLAYVIYTSGSTGTPKGVMIEHRNTVNFISWARTTLPVSAFDRTLQSTSLNFDLSVYECFVPLSVGGSIRVVKNALALVGAMVDVTLINTVPSAIKALAESGGIASSARIVNLAGEALKQEVVERIFAASNVELVCNLYGPTETTTYSTWIPMQRERGFVPSIGKPISNTQIYILDSRREPVPLGVSGEIYIGGAGVARGYLNREELTAERFLADPFSADASARMYRTGDLGRWQDDGTIEYLGRNDHQVKVRGYRIELGEIEAQLARDERVKEAAVIVREDTAGEKRLVAYVVGRDGSLSIEALRGHLKAMMPEYMVPSAFVALERLPLTANGKLDRRALPTPDASAYASREYQAPQGELEQSLAGIWRDLLHVSRVSRDDNFFDLGGDSLLALQMLARIGSILSLDLSVQQFFSHATICQVATLLANAARSAPAIQQQNRIDALPLSWAQQRLWFIDRLEGGSAAYHVPVGMRLQGELDVTALQRAIERVIERHESLRTVFVEMDGEPMQKIEAQSGFHLQRLDLSTMEQQRREQALQERLREGLAAPFELSTGPLIRGSLVKLSDQEHVLLITMHHIVSDGWSVGVLIKELGALYEAYRQGQGDPLSALPIQYGDYAQWQRQWLSGQELERQLKYWREHLEGAPELLELPTDRRRAAVQSYRGGNVEVALDEQLTRQLKLLSRRHDATLAMTLYAGWTVLLSRLSGQRDLVVGMPVANRRRTELEGLIGFFVNTLAVRVSMEDDPTVQELLGRVKEVMLGAYAHQDVPFEEVVKALQPTRSLSHSPIFQVMFVFQNAPAGELQLAQLSLEEQEVLLPTAQFDLTLTLQESADGIRGSLNYASGLFDASTMTRWSECFECVLRAMVSEPQLQTSQLSLLNTTQRRQVLELFNATQATYPTHKLIHELFEEQVERTPHATAVTFEDQSLSYAELEARSNQLARHLRECGVGADQLVAICVERGLEMIVGLLGILKAGGAYVPLDPNYPIERLEYMLQDAQPKVLLTQEQLRARLPASGTVITLDGDWSRIAGQPSERLPRAPGLHSASLAYVIYTSGSTGAPKGVMIEHKNVTRLFAATQHWFGFNERDVWTLFHSFAFDFSVWELWGALFYGGRLVVVPHLVTRSPQDFYRLLCDEHVTVLNQTPSAFAQVIDAQARDMGSKHDLRVVIFGGEALELHTLQPWVERNGVDQPRLINMYGITETTVHVTYRPPLTRSQIESERGSMIGTAIPDLRVYLLDQHAQPVPIGVTGEIHVSGAGVARGYLNRSQLTSQRFMADPFGADTTARMYKSGDLGRWRADGSIEYLGRNDHQVKIRGFRIELGEIEAQLACHADVKDAVVLARAESASDKRLVAYIVPDGRDLSPAALRTHLKSRLPDHMIPSAFVLLDALPLTANGKLDRRALPEPEHAAVVIREYQPPRGAIEEVLVRICEGLLGIARVGRDDNFFELGGHSLLIVQLLDRLRRVGLCADVRSVYECRTLADLARSITKAPAPEIKGITARIPPGCGAITPDMVPLAQLEPAHIEKIVAAIPGGADNIQDIYPLVALQEGILFHHVLGEQSTDTYVRPSLWSFSTRDHLDRFIVALQTVINRHDVLRTAVLWEQLPRALQVVQRRAALPIEEVLLDRERDPVEQLEELMQCCRIDLRNAPLLRLHIARGSHGEWHGILLTHHIVCDNEALAVMFGEIEACLSNRSNELTEAVPYREHVEQVLATSNPQAAEAFFRGKLASIDEPTAPFGVMSVHVDGSRNESIRWSLEARVSRRIRWLARQLGVSPATLFHAAWAVVVSRATGRTDVVFGTVLLGRLQADPRAQRAMGMFINTLPLRLRLDNVSASQLLERTHRELADLLSYEQTPLATAQRCSGVAGAVPLFTALLNYVHGGIDLQPAFGEDAGVHLVETQGGTNYPIVLSVGDREQDFVLELRADPRIDLHRLKEYVGTALQSLTHALEGAPDTAAQALSILPPSERQQLLESFHTTHAYERDVMIHELFERQADRVPSQLAVVDAARSLTYAQLNTHANQLAHYLRAHGARPGQRVAICVERGLEMAVALLSILKSGAAYVPLDPIHPDGRLSHMLTDSGALTVLAQPHIRKRIESMRSGCAITEIDISQWKNSPWAELSPLNIKADVLGLTSSHLAYVIYTSGSTGLPKGVMVEHGNVTNFVRGMEERIHAVAPRCRNVAWNSSLGFDMAVKAWAQLLMGRTVYIVPEDVRVNGGRLLDFMEDHEIEAIECTPSHLRMMIEAGLLRRRARSVRKVLLGGEPIDPALWKVLSADPNIAFFNMYGPTECTVDASCGPIRGEKPNVGTVMPNARIYMLDSRREPVPIGVSGEIYIGGAGVARGYLNREELTAERFIADPFSSDASARMYRTGDLGRWQEDGTIEYLGRNDHQVKVRGYRIELGEIEAQLARDERVKEAAVIVREDTAGEKRLVAYVVGRDGPLSIEALREHLKAMMPEYMVPSAFVALERLPLTANGKLDRRALPTPDASAYASREYQAPQGELEQSLAGIWRDLLHVSRVSRDDNFFDLGGDSLLTMQLAVRLESALPIQLPIRLVFERPMLREQAARIDELCRAHVLETIVHGGEGMEELLDSVASMPSSEVWQLMKEFSMEKAL